MTTTLGSIQPSTWVNQKLPLFHGTTNVEVPSILTGINLANARTSTDFGKGFYTTTVERQALSWAWQLSQQRPGTVPAVIQFDVDRDSLAKLDCIWFVRGSYDAHDFWSVVFHCRSGRAAHRRVANQGWYDVVIGPVAASWRQRLTIYDADQVSFHSGSAVRLLDNSQPRRIV